MGPDEGGANPGRTYAAEDPFSYACGRCGACCSGREVLVNLHDVERLADALGVSGAAVAARWLKPGRSALAAGGPRHTCVFFDPGRGCTVHAHRPAACRFYPLGRHVTPTRGAHWVELEPDPASAGRYGRDGAVSAYLEGQDAGESLAAIEALSAFVDDALIVAYRAGVLADADAMLARVRAGEAGHLPTAILDLDALGGDRSRPLLERLAGHLEALAQACGMRLDPVAQVQLDDTAAGRGMRARLVQTIAVVGVGLGLAPGFSEGL